MVKKPGTLVLLAVGACFSFESLLRPDPTTSWCYQASSSGRVPDWYHCYPNPLGFDRMEYWWRIPDTLQVNGCLLVNRTNRFPIGGLVPYGPWHRFTIQANGGPRVPRIDLDLDSTCASLYRTKGVFNIHAGDSIRLEYKMTSRDTSVTDTIRGEMKAYYTGRIFKVGVSHRSGVQPMTASWRQGAVLLSVPHEGPFELIDLRGHVLRSTSRIEGQGTWVAPVAIPSPGLYQVRWPGGAAGILIMR